MPGPLTTLEESAERLLTALGAHDNPRAAAEECFAEMADNFNNYAYQLEQENNEDD